MGQLVSHPSLTTRRDIRIHMQGYFGAGKKSILERLEVNAEKIKGTKSHRINSATYKNITVHTWDLGGRVDNRGDARNYYSLGVDVLLMVVDSADDYYLGQAQAMLGLLVTDKYLQDTIILVLANKQDLPAARSVEEMALELDFDEVTKSHDAHIMGCSAETGEGIEEAVGWLVQTLATKKEREIKEKQKSRSLLSYMKGGFQSLKSKVLGTR